LLTCLLYRLLCGLVRLLARGGGEREFEIVVLRHQLAILRRGGRRPQYTAVDRAVLAAASRLLPPERWSCFAVSPRTLRRWHRALSQGNRRRRGRRPGRPPLAAETRSLILRLARENPRWGYVRIQGELLKLGISVSATTVASVLRVSGLGPAPRRIGPSWSEFLCAQAQSMLGAGLPSEPAGRLEGNMSARSAPTPEAATCGVEAEQLSTNTTEEPSPSWPVPGLPRLSAVAAVPSPCDSTATPLRSSQQWHARDGPKTRRRPLHTRAVRPGMSKPRLLAPRPASELQPPVGFPGAAARLFT
jgi:homeodomain-containing protein